MFNRFLTLLICVFFLVSEGQSQIKGVLPFTGIKYFFEGVSFSSAEIKVDGLVLLNNRIPLNKEFEIRLLLPKGFTEDKTKMIFAAAELNVVSMKGDIVSKTPNVFKDNEAKGFPSNTFKEIIVKLILRPEFIKADPGCTIKVRYYDLKSKNQLRLEFPVTIARPGEVLMTTKATTEIKVAAPTLAQTTGLKVKNINVTVDTSIRVNPKMAYASLDITGIEGTSMSEVLSGKESFWVYDENLNEVKISDKQLKQVGGAMENNVVNYLSKIPFRLKTATGKLFTVRFRWESTDKRKVIDVVVTK